MTVYFSRTEISCSVKIMNTIYGNIQYIERNDIDIEAVADIAGPMRIVQHMKVISPVILNLFVVLAISKSK